MVYSVLFKKTNLTGFLPSYQKLKYLKVFYNQYRSLKSNLKGDRVLVKNFYKTLPPTFSIEFRYYIFYKSCLLVFFRFLNWSKAYPYFKILFLKNIEAFNTFPVIKPSFRGILKIDSLLISQYLVINRLFSLQKFPPLSSSVPKSTWIPLPVYYLLVILYLI